MRIYVTEKVESLGSYENSLYGREIILLLMNSHNFCIIYLAMLSIITHRFPTLNIKL